MIGYIGLAFLGITRGVHFADYRAQPWKTSDGYPGFLLSEDAFVSYHYIGRRSLEDGGSDREVPAWATGLGFPTKRLPLVWYR